MQPLVSIIMPVYNTEAYVAQAISSALAQTLKNIEIIVVDNCSTDRSVEVIQSFTDRRITFLQNPQNLGATASCNRAMRAATGRWIAILDSDDWIAPERLERMVLVAEAEAADLIVDDLFLIRDGEATAWSTLLSESDRVINQIQQIDPVFFVETDLYGKRRCLRLGLTKPLFRRQFLEQHGIQYDETLQSVYDFWIDLTCLVKGAKFILLPEPYYFYRARAGSSVSKKRTGWLNECCQATERFIQQPITQQNPALVRALSRQLARFQRYRAYYQVTEPLKEKQYIKAVAASLHYPIFFVQCLRQLPGVVSRRIQYHLLGNKTAFDMLPQNQPLKPDILRGFVKLNRLGKLGSPIS